MSISASSPFGARSALPVRRLGAAADTTQDRPKAEFWLNIGYMSSALDDDGNEKDIFVSLSQGIPLDQCETYKVEDQRTQNMAVLRQAQNELLAGFLDRAKQLEAGTSAVVSHDPETGLAMEIKRVRGPQAMPTENTLKRAFSFR